jgi:hypothetical protein
MYVMLDVVLFPALRFALFDLRFIDGQTCGMLSLLLVPEPVVLPSHKMIA